MNVEQEISAFMDSMYYGPHFISFERKIDAGSQLNGIDVVANHSEYGNLIIDDKAATHYINKNLPTFAFEVNFLHRGMRVNGWFYDMSKSTTHYNLQWLKANTSDVWNLKREEITEVHSLLIERKTIIAYVEKEGFSQSRIEELAEYLNRTNHNGSFSIGHSSMKMFRSARLTEAPVNLIIPKATLSSLALMDITITK